MSTGPRKFSQPIQVPSIQNTSGTTIINTSAVLNNNRIIVSSSNAFTEASAITASRALISDTNGIPTHSSVTSTELGYVSGVTSAIQTQLGAKLSLSGGTMSGAIAMGGNAITGLSSPSASSDAATKGYVDSVLSLTGSIVNADVSSSAAIAYSKLNLSGSIVNADVSGSAAIAYSKLNLSGSVVNADISNTAAIAYSKLNLSASIVNADIATGAAIARSKLASGTASHVVINDGSGVLSSEAQLSALRGGTGVNASAASNGQLLIGNGSGFSLAALTQGTGITITNGSGTITIAANGANANDIAETSFSGANNQATLANITGFAFANANVRSFQALVSVYVNATSSLYENFVLRGIQRGADWVLSYDSTGDASGVAFDITNAGQVQYTSGSYTGFSALTIKFRAITTAA